MQKVKSGKGTTWAKKWLAGGHVCGVDSVINRCLCPAGCRFIETATH